MCIILLENLIGWVYDGTIVKVQTAVLTGYTGRSENIMKAREVIKLSGWKKGSGWEYTNDISAAAAALGRKGGKSKSEAKAKAARENGKKGGRPRKSE